MFPKLFNPHSPGWTDREEDDDIPSLLRLLQFDNAYIKLNITKDVKKKSYITYLEVPTPGETPLNQIQIMN